MSEIITKQVRSIVFSLLSPEQIKKIGAAKIITPELYDMDGYPVDGGVMDLRLGAIDPGVRCRTCGGKLKECLGHPGYIEIARPVVHLKYVPFIEVLLRSTCQECGRVLLNEENLKNLSISARLKKSKDVKKCPYCKAEQEKIKIEKPTTFHAGRRRIFPNEIRARLARITDDDYTALGFNPRIRPEWFILTLLIVPPVTTRPSITLETGERSEDDLTHKICDIVRANQRLWENLNAGAPEVIVEDIWDLLQYHVTTFFDNTITQVPPARHRSGQPLETLTERIKGKEGRIRHNLAGKRVNFSSRTVISPDSHIKINEVGIPLEIAKVLTIPEKVTTENIELLKKLVAAGENYPGANYIIRPDGKRKRITEELKEELLEEVIPGYTVERHLCDGDIVLFNRHPSLHKHSLMSHHVKILPGKTFKLNPCTTEPYNADFDGDEMNIHVPQTEEAKAESEILMNVNTQLISPKNNTNELGCKGDGITGNYLLSFAQMPKGDAVQLLVESGIPLEKIQKEKFKEIVTGKEIFSAALPKMSFERRTKACHGESCPYYDSKAKDEKSFAHCKKEKCPFNAYLSISDGKLVSGIVDDHAVGVENGLLIKELDRQVGREETILTLERLFMLGVKYLSRVGFTTSLNEVNMPSIKEGTSKIIKKAEEKVNDIIDSYNKKTLESLPGRTKEETRETRILQTLNNIRTELGEIIKGALAKDNPANIMMTSGAAGSIVPIMQMACSVGQQSLWAKRIELGYTKRTLSMFKPNDLSPRAHGFIRSGYFDGLDADEFFFGAITGRDSLMDTALRTPKSGYLYRRAANALQDLKVEYDGTVRDASGKVVQYEYGGDGKDVERLHLENNKISPGEAVGIITAQSFGQPATQMVLNVFHWAGISEMQVTLGLPRLIEIFDARRKPSTPAMDVHLLPDYNSSEGAKAVAEKIKQIRLEDITKEISIKWTDNMIEVVLDKSAMKDLRINPDNILKKLAEEDMKAKIKDDSIIIKTEGLSFKDVYKLKEKLKEFIVSGVKGITQVLIVMRGNNYVILTGGSNLEDVLKIKGVCPEKTITNDIYEIEKIFGIEAAREIIIYETKKVISKQGFDIDERHMQLIADTMTTSGNVKGITRVGIIGEKASVLARASFETPVKQFVSASIQESRDDLKSVIENIILNQAVPVGTGLPGLLVEITGRLAEKPKEKSKGKEK